MADLEQRIPNRSDLLFDIASLSKQFVAASVLLLAEQGKLGLDDEVRRWVPELPRYRWPVTLRHLLHHTSGIRDYLVLFELAGVDFIEPVSDRQVLDMLARQRDSNFAPGEQWLYSNSGYFLLGLVVERAGGAPLAEFSQQHLFKPLGMKDTVFPDRRTRSTPPRATGYSPAPGRRFRPIPAVGDPSRTGAVLTTVDDLMRWERHLHGQRAANPLPSAQMLMAGTLNDGTPLGYAAGVHVGEHQGWRRVRHEGAWAGYRAGLLGFPELSFSVACLCNLGTIDAGMLAERVADVYLAGVANIRTLRAGAALSRAAAAETPQLQPEKLLPLAGYYRSPSTGQIRRIEYRNAKLHIDLSTVSGRELRHLAESRFAVEHSTSRVQFLSGPGSRRIKLTAGDGSEDILTALDATPPPGVQLDELEGTYHSAELAVSFQLGAQDDHLVLTPRHGGKRLLRPVHGEVFAAAGMQLVFQRDATGRITTFRLHTERARDLVFVKQ